MALFNFRFVLQTDPQLIALAQDDLQAQRLIAANLGSIAEATDRIAIALVKIAAELEAPEEQVPASASWTIGNPEQED